MRKRRIAILIDYDGTDFVGWQFQSNGRSVQGEIEAAVRNLFGESIRIQGAGRTDSGVHAAGQVAHFDLANAISLEKLSLALNSALARDVRILNAWEAGPEFHARRDAIGKLYSYYLLDGGSVPSIHRRWIGWFPHALSLDRMAQASAHWLGKHDFTSFRAADCDARSPVKTMERISVERIPIIGVTDGRVIRMSFEAPSFLKHQIRAMVGTLVEIGRGRRDPDWARDVLAARARSAAGPTFEPTGLVLERVDYLGDRIRTAPGDHRGGDQEAGFVHCLPDQYPIA